MRVTNGMIRNNTLNNLYKNISSLNKTYGQMSTGKKIQTVSDDPIIAGRSLKLNINVLETQQYQKTAKEARSWMEVTETSLDNMKDILTSIRTKSVQASTGTLAEKDKAAIKTDIAQLWEQLQEEANVTYGGRYVYSGYKTSEPLMLKKDTTLSEDCSLTTDYVTTGTVTLKAGSEIPAGSTIAKGTTLAGADAVALGLLGAVAGTPYPVTQDAGVTVASDWTVTSDTTIASGSMLHSDLEAATPVATKLVTGTSLSTGNLNPLVYGKITNHDMNYEVGTANNINVNVLGMDATFKDLVKMMNEIITTVDKSLEAGTTVTSDDLHKLFNDKLGEIDEVLADISTKTADLGSRMARLDYVDGRLTDNVADYKELLSNTENVDVEEVYTQFNSQYAAYNAALQATSKVIMNTLADYI